MSKKVDTRDGFKYGVEIECMVPQGSAEDDVTTACERLHCEVGGDGSINEDYDYQGIEIKTPPLKFNQTLQRITDVMGVLAENDGKVNQSCGLHVHVSHPKFLEQKHLKRIIHVWLSIEDVLVCTQPQSRFNNGYARRLLRQHVVGDIDVLPRAKEELMKKARSLDRYFALNIHSLYAHGTLECRLHAGTVNAIKINNWQKLLTEIYTYAIDRYDVTEINALYQTKISLDKVKTVFAMLGLSKELIEFYMIRINQRALSHVFELLGKQQEGAWKSDETRPKLIKARILHERARRRLDEREREFSDIIRPVAEVF